MIYNTNNIGARVNAAAPVRETVFWILRYPGAPDRSRSGWRTWARRTASSADRAKTEMPERRLRLLLGVALVGAAVAAFAGAAPKPGAKGIVAGQVAAQKTQAQTAPKRSVSAPPGAADWWAPNQGGTLPARADYADPAGRFAVLNVNGPTNTAGHPFFTPLGANGRACVSCHQPAHGMSVSVDAIRARWTATAGKDPIFAAVDGSNCPRLPQGARASHSLLLDRGLFRIFLPWPPRAADGSRMTPEFDITVVRDPTGCNTDPVYGLRSANPIISVFRRPRPVMNLRYVQTADGFFNIKTGMPFARDLETGRPVSMQLMADAREPTLRSQAIEAAITHLQAKEAPTPAQLAAIVAFENGLYGAQSQDRRIGGLGGAGEPDGLGPEAMSRKPAGQLGDNTVAPVFGRFDAWAGGGAGGDAKARAFRQSTARGAEVFLNRPFWIRDVTHLNSIGLGNPIKRSCATCHNSYMTGMDLAPGWMDLGVNNLPYADPRPDLPLFRVTCHADADPHPYLGRVILTHDPGRALITGKCVDVGAITMQQMRGLAARAPFFANGSARTLAELVDYYDRRFGMKLKPRERTDLINFLGVL